MPRVQSPAQVLMKDFDIKVPKEYGTRPDDKGSKNESYKKEEEK